MRKTRHRRRSRRRRSRKMRGGMFGIGDALAKAGSILGLTRPQGEDKEKRSKSPPPTGESPFESPANLESNDTLREPKQQENVGKSPEQMGGKKRRRRRKSKKKRGGGCGCAATMSGGKRKRRRRRTHKKKRKSRRRRR